MGSLAKMDRWPEYWQQRKCIAKRLKDGHAFVYENRIRFLPHLLGICLCLRTRLFHFIHFTTSRYNVDSRVLLPTLMTTADK